LNYSEAWLLSVVSDEQWNSDYKDILTLTFDEADKRREAQRKWRPADESGKGEFVLERHTEGTSEIRGFTLSSGNQSNNTS